MKGFIYAVMEVRKNLNVLLIFSSLLTALVLFLGIYFLFATLAFNGLYAIIPTLIYIGYDLYYTLNKSRIVDVENKYPELNEKFRTAAEYAKEEGNPFVDELHKEVVHDLKKVELSSFINTRKTTIKLGAIVVLCFLIVFFAQFGLYFDITVGVENVIEKVKPVFTDSSDGSGSGGDESTIGKEGNEGIYGEASLAELTDEEVDISIFTSSMELNTRNVFDAQHREFEEATLFPEDIFTQEAEVSTEGEVSREHVELVKNYFLQTAQTK
jgi:hypothetical protein|tara:strand:+ start:34 stop:840 length:807 start_codon:yes stop_codon:yes gene_type:complete